MDNSPPPLAQVCSKCGETKPLSSFGSRTLRCKLCAKQIWSENKLRQGQDPVQFGREKKNQKRALARLGLTPADLPEAEWHLNAANAKRREAHYAERSARQNGLCAICENPETRTQKGKSTRLGRDHCHTSGAWRGLLCHSCNIALGYFRENLQTLQKALEYLIRWAPLTLEQCGVYKPDKRRAVAPDERCEICDKPESRVQAGQPQTLCQDHCHKTGKKRGLLCFRCNLGIHHLRESVQVLRAASQYLADHGVSEQFGDAVTGVASEVTLFRGAPKSDWSLDGVLTPTGSSKQGVRRYT